MTVAIAVLVGIWIISLYDQIKQLQEKLAFAESHRDELADTCRRYREENETRIARIPRRVK